VRLVLVLEIDRCFSIQFFWSAIARWRWFALFFGGFPVVDRERRSLVLLTDEI
jgi:hypothetical protein